MNNEWAAFRWDVNHSPSPGWQLLWRTYNIIISLKKYWNNLIQLLNIPSKTQLTHIQFMIDDFSVEITISTNHFYLLTLKYALSKARDWVLTRFDTVNNEWATFRWNANHEPLGCKAAICCMPFAVAWLPLRLVSFRWWNTYTWCVQCRIIHISYCGDW